MISHIKYGVAVKKWFSVSGQTEVEAGFRYKKDAVAWARLQYGPKWHRQHEIITAPSDAPAKQSAPAPR